MNHVVYKFENIINGKALAEVGTLYLKSTKGTFAATLVKKYRRYFIRYIFEKVRYSVSLFGTYQKKNFAHFGNNIFDDFMS